MTARLTYDFGDYQLSDMADLEAFVRNQLRDAFEAFADQGRWFLSEDGSGSLRWEVKEIFLDDEAAAIWKDALPIDLSVTPEELSAACRSDLDEDMFGDDGETILKAVARWRASLDEIERVVRERQGKP